MSADQKNDGEKSVRRRKTRLESLRINKKIIESPLKRLEKLHLQSWAHHGICDVLWATLVRSAFNQEKSLKIFRLVLMKMLEEPKRFDKTILTHSTLADLSVVDFDDLFEPLFAKSDLRSLLAPLLLIECLPDRHHWVRHLDIMDEDDCWSRLADAVGNVFNHQSQEATDLRWLKPMSLIASDKMHFPDHLSHLLENIIYYPNSGDMESVRPSLRANEGAIRSHEELEGKGALPWAEKFWSECWDKTACILINPDNKSERAKHDSIIAQAENIARELQSHFINNLTTTGVDARHDSSFGIVFYLIQLFMFCAGLRIGHALPARLILRTALECYITLAFLSKKDDPTIWLQFRNYGSGQARLSFLKMSEQDELVSFISRETLETLASEDFWHEFLDIKLGSWSNKNLRDMAIEADIKPIYDRYYDGLSAYIHGNWGAILHTSFGFCGNALHRFHRIPHPPRNFTHDAVPDLVKILNLSLDLITSLYPPFKSRIRINNTV